MKPLSGLPRRYRQSTQESAEQAEGIFDLYGANASVPPKQSVGYRDSVASGYSQTSQVSGLAYRDDEREGRNGGTARPEMVVEEDEEMSRNGHGPSHSRVPRIEGAIDEDAVESLQSLDSWRGPMNAMSNRASMMSLSSEQDFALGSASASIRQPASHLASPRDSLGPPAAYSTPQKNNDAQLDSIDRTRSRERSRTPLLTITPDMSPSKRMPSNEDDSRLSTFTASTSTGGTNNGRLTPRLSMTASSAGASTYAGEASMSQASIQYPGEEADAFHVRSTYARLESEGVFGDGWDPGVERTRGGPNVGKRVTVMEQQKGSTVGEKERGYLSNLDRYGFIREPLKDRNESRLALIPASPLSKVPKLPSHSPLAGKPTAQPTTLGMNGNSGQPSAPHPRIPSPDADGGKSRRKEKETERVGKWMRMMGVKKREGGNAVEWVWKGEGQAKSDWFEKNNWSGSTKSLVHYSNSELRRRVYKGVPDRWRMTAWWTLAEEQVSRGQSRGRKSGEQMFNNYRNTIDLPSTHDVQIDLDVPRTISGHTLFVTRYGAGQRSLFHVLHCFSLLCETCGYCQGMGPIAATLLCYFDPERTYAQMVRLHDVYGMHSIFAPGFPGLLEAFYVQERLMEWLMPDVYQCFQRNMISSSAWGTKWYITLFVNTVPFSTQLRLWDALWLDGRDVIVATAIAIVWSFKDLLAHPSATFESILSLLSSNFVPEDEDALLRWIKRLLHQPRVKEKMDGWRVEWADLVKQGKDGEALL